MPFYFLFRWAVGEKAIVKLQESCTIGIKATRLPYYNSVFASRLDLWGIPLYSRLLPEVRGTQRNKVRIATDTSFKGRRFIHASNAARSRVTSGNTEPGTPTYCVETPDAQP